MDLDSNRLTLGKKPALILVDIINGFTNPDCELGTECPSVISANNELLAIFRQNCWPVYFTTVVYENKKQASVFRQKLPALNCLQVGSFWIEIDQRLNRRKEEMLIKKQHASAFFGTDLAPQLIKEDVDCLVVTELTTSGCVRATAVDGLQHNYPVFIPRQAVADRNSKSNESNLYDLGVKYAEVVELSVLKRNLMQL